MARACAGRAVLALKTLIASTMLVLACAPAASPTTAPAKPAEQGKPAEPAKPAAQAAPAATAAPAASPAAAPAAPAASPAAALAASPAAKPSAPGKLDTVSYGIGSLNALHWVVIAAERTKIFEQYGVNLDIVITQNVPSALQALIGGSLSITTTSPEGAFPAQDKAPELAQVAGVLEANPYSLVVNPKISSVADLKGKSLGASALKTGVDTVALRLIMYENGLQDERDYNVVPVGSVAERVAALRSGSVSGIAHMEPFLGELMGLGFKILTSAGDYPSLRQAESVIIIANKKWYTQNEDAAVRFIRGYQAATRWLYDPKNREDAITYLAEKSKVDPKYVANAYKLFVQDLKAYPVDARINRAILKQTVANFGKLGIDVPTNTEKYIDDSLVDKALKSQ
ncbi:MAG: ABC transporter substrate-binding protein [Chloroflexi bacterium]|nr:ABC transporter substrate-binding protein [Chloroflexota bacterium]